MTPQEEEDAKVAEDLQAIARLQLGRAWQRIAELEGDLRQAIELLKELRKAE